MTREKIVCICSFLSIFMEFFSHPPESPEKFVYELRKSSWYVRLRVLLFSTSYSNFSPAHLTSLSNNKLFLGKRISVLYLTISTIVARIQNRTYQVVEREGGLDTSRLTQMCLAKCFFTLVYWIVLEHNRKWKEKLSPNVLFMKVMGDGVVYKERMQTSFTFYSNTTI